MPLYKPLISKIQTKTRWVVRRLSFAMHQTPMRLWRLLTFWVHPFYRRETPSVRWAAAVFLLGDLLFWWDFFEILTNVLRSKTRLLTDIEIEIGKEIFGKNIDLQLVMINGESFLKLVTTLFKVDMAFAYVSFNTINCKTEMPSDVLVHELVHVWQYQKFGAGYIPTALAAQKTEAGYNYSFSEGWLESGSLLEFNTEQQADIVQDAYRHRMGKRTQWNTRGEELHKFLVDLDFDKRGENAENSKKSENTV